MTTNFLEGLGVALATPFERTTDGLSAASIDLDAYGRLVRRVIDGGADFIVALGSTGEAATVTDEERALCVSTAVEEARGVPVVVGTGHNCTAKAAQLSRAAMDLGARGVLVVTPYYNKPQPAGIEAHYRVIAEAIGGAPIVVYNVPGRTGQNLSPATLARLWTIPSVVAVKESSGNLAQIGEIARTLPAGKILLAGDDALALPAMALGARGLVSVIGNVLPAEIKSMVSLALEGRFDEARAVHGRLLPFMDALFAETNPAPVKAALSLCGIGSDAVRLPLVPAGESTRTRIAELIEGFLPSIDGAVRPTARKAEACV